MLAKEEHDRARLVAQHLVKKQAQKYGLPPLTAADMNEEAVKGVVADLAACEVLAMACTQTKPFVGSKDVDDNPQVRYPRVWPDGEAVGKTLSADEVAFLFAAYTMVQHKFGPHEALVGTEEEINAWVKRLALGAADYPFLRLSSPQWVELLTGFATRLLDLSGILESQWESLPESLKSDLRTFCLDTGSASEQPENALQAGTELPGPGREISFEEAMRVANVLSPKPTQE
ncbi:MAG TPA: hypothetical protein VL494_13710 [Steroidobacteraceae bacterium]|nr:hypothetical protein [Steroidobacteraceae bacterium]